MSSSSNCTFERPAQVVCSANASAACDTSAHTTGEMLGKPRASSPIPAPKVHHWQFCICVLLEQPQQMSHHLRVVVYFTVPHYLTTCSSTLY
mmetsp:Transcript_9876/g.16398  ORF Transcript_9876/g.16398 Transcript_9876/m.16398 type:complete len:92 (+) Transcript_9876:575-850(+)